MHIKQGILHAFPQNVTFKQAYKLHRTMGPQAPEEKIDPAENVQN